MDQREILLMMTLCELLGKKVNASQVVKAYEYAIKRMEQEQQGPRDAR